MPLAALLIPLIPSLIQGVMSIIDTIRNHPTTPADMKTQLDTAAAHLASAVSAVAAAQLPKPR